MSTAAQVDRRADTAAGLVEPQRITHLLRRVLKAEPQLRVPLRGARADRCFPLRDGGFSWEWSVVAPGGGRWSVFGITGSKLSRSVAPPRTRPEWTSSGLRGLALRVKRPRVMVYSLDADARLPQLPDCLDADGMVRRLQGEGLLNGRRRTRAEKAGCRVLGYRAGRRATLAYGVDDRTLAVGKTWRDERAQSQWRLYERVREQLREGASCLTVAEAIGVVPALHMTLFRPADGANASLRGIVRSPDRPPRIGDLLPALRELHRLHLPELTPFGAQDELGVLRRWLEALHEIAPRAARAMNPLVDRAARRAESLESGPRCTIHRDFHPHQVVPAPGGWTLFDLDTLAVGSPCLDLGNLFAHACLEGARRGRSTSSLWSEQPRIGEAYRACGGFADPAELDFYSATSLIRVGAVHALRTATRRATPLLWALARRILNRSATQTRNRGVHRPKGG